MLEWEQVFKEHAVEYDQILAREDYQKNIPRALDQICPYEGADVVELGAGTGRFTCMLAPRVKTIVAFDASRHMLESAVAKLDKLELQNWSVGIADNRHLPVGDQSADVAIAGWTLGVFLGWLGETWRPEIELALAQMMRVLRPGGVAIIIETLGTGRETPGPPPALAPYYAYLEKERGFHSTWIRTDFQFESRVEAEVLIRFFWGDELADKVAGSGALIVPECTGIWWLTV
ncbi:MAG: class I SAM-dependent methyltransferase [Chloroflexi bacterium]|nr:class I SAM-dependent methyltransferase [Chloroflexota bacterium]